MNGPIFTKFSTLMYWVLQVLPANKILQILKSKMVAAAILKILVYLNRLTNFDEIWLTDPSDPLEPVSK